MRLGNVLVLVGIAGAGLYLLSAAAGGQRPSAATPPATPDLRIGSTFEDGTWRYRVMQADVATKIEQRRFGVIETYMPKGQYVIVTVDLTNLSRVGNATLRQSAFELVEAGGVRYSPITLIGLEPAEGQVRLGEAFPPNVTVRTQVIFDVTPGTRGMRIYLVPAGAYVRLE